MNTTPANKNVREIVMFGIAVSLIVGFRAGILLMKRDLRSESHSTAVQEGIHSDYVKLTVHGNIKYDLKEFQAIQTGMTFAQVQTVLHLTGLKQNINDSVPNPNDLDALVVFKDVDGSSIEVVFHHDSAVSKRRFSAVMNAVVEDQNKKE